MTKQHLKRTATPISWPIKRKETVFVSRPYPGAHSMDKSFPIGIFLKEVIHEATSSREVKKILQKNDIICNGKRLLDPKSPVGFLDTISIPKLEKYYRIIMNRKGKLSCIEIPEKESLIRIAKIVNKTKIKGGKTQLNLNNGRNIIANKDQENFKIGSSVLLNLPDQEVQEYLPLEKKSVVLLQAGKYKGAIGIVESIMDKKIIIKTKKGEMFETPKKYSIVCGKDKPLILVSEAKE